MDKTSLALSCVTLLGASTMLALPGAATAAKGGSGGGSTACVPAVAVNTGTVDKPSSRKRVVPEVEVTNCGGAEIAVGFRVVATRHTLRSQDP